MDLLTDLRQIGHHQIVDNDLEIDPTVTALEIARSEYLEHATMHGPVYAHIGLLLRARRKVILRLGYKVVIGDDPEKMAAAFVMQRDDQGYFESA